MRWIAALAQTVLVLPFIAPSGNASELATAPRPEVLSAAWNVNPLVAGENAILKIRARDRDGIISSVDVYWGDHSFTHADLICFDTGEVAKVLLDHTYLTRGRYIVKIQAFSSDRCFGPTQQHSPVRRLRTRVVTGRPST